MNDGCFHGRLLSTILCNIVIDNLLRKLNPAGYNAEGFADDVVILLIGKELELINGKSKGNRITNLYKWEKNKQN